MNCMLVGFSPSLHHMASWRLKLGREGTGVREDRSMRLFPLPRGGMMKEGSDSENGVKSGGQDGEEDRGDENEEETKEEEDEGVVGRAPTPPFVSRG